MREPRIIQGDCRELAKDIPDHSVDLIFTDPPYSREYLYLYEWLATETPRILKDDGFLLVYIGVYHKNTVIRYLDEKMEYFWDLAAVNYQGPGPMIWQRKIVSKYKSILIYHRKGFSPMPRTNVLSVFNGTDHDKRYHAWQQDAATARYYIDCFSKRGDLVVDFFCGGGTTPAMCKIIDRECLAFDNDPAAISSTINRLRSTQPFLFETWQQISNDILTVDEISTPGSTSR